MSWYSNIDSPQLESLVLVFARIERCHQIAKLDLPLDGRLQCKFTQGDPPTLELKTKPDFVDLFGAHKINLSIICGKNGIGKTTILELLSARLPHRGELDYRVVLRDAAGNYLANCPMRVRSESGILLRLDRPLDHYDIKLSTLCANRVLADDEHFGLRKNIASHYVTHRSLYDDANGQVFTHFSVDYLDSRNLAEELAQDLNLRMNWQLNGFEIESYLKEYPLFFAFLCVAQDNTFDPLFSALKERLRPSDIKGLHQAFKALDPDGSGGNEILALIGEINKGGGVFADPIAHAYPIAEYHEISRRLTTLSEKVDEAIRKFVERLKAESHKPNLHFEEHILRQRMLYLRPFKETLTGRRFLENMSRGEQADIWNRFILHPCMVQRDACWLYLDEPDIHLHPEWKRQFLAQFMKAVQATREYLAAGDDLYRRKFYTVLMTTHSPFLLSDVTTDHALLLDRNAGDQTYVRESRTNTFAGNIGEMFYEQFFLDETVGKFAGTMLDAAITRLDHADPLTAGEDTEYERLFSVVGDKLLKRLLMGKLEEKRREKN